MISVFFLRKLFLLIFDVFLFFSAFFLTLMIGFGENISPDIILSHLIPFSILLPFLIIILSLIGGYNLRNLGERYILLLRITIYWIILFFTSVLFFYVFPEFGITPKTNLLFFSLIFSGLIFLERELISKVFSSFFQRKLVIIGKTKESLSLIESLKKNPQLGWKFINFFPSENPEKILREIEDSKIDTIIFAKDISSNKKLEDFLYKKLLSSKINFLDIVEAYAIIFKKIPIGFVNQSWFLENLREGKKEFYDKTKRIIDIIFSSFALIILSPIYLIIPLLIKLEDNGPIFYSQIRMGKNLRKFKMTKFRTMKKEIHQNWKPWTKGKRDPRITKVGKILRHLHFDEIPQFLNILKGELSFIGPRPENLETIAFLEKEIPHYHLRHLIKPGFTGLAQINLAYISTMGTLENKKKKIKYDFEKVEYDLYYIKNRSFILDLNILLKSFKLFFRI